MARTSGSARASTGTSRWSARTTPGRRQYLYHPEWRRIRDEAKFDRVLSMASALPQGTHSASSLTSRATPALTRSRVLRTAVRLIDVGYFRIGSDVYADEHGSYGLTTLERRHVRKTGRLPAASRSSASPASTHDIAVDDPTICAVVRAAAQASGRRRSVCFPSRTGEGGAR
ncbi:MAG: hypothetical protein WKF82_10245 [Nocardioidaceae bacterium]